MEIIDIKTCSNCGSSKFNGWEDLSDEEKFTLDRILEDSRFSGNEKRRQRYCERCLFVQIDISDNIV